MGLIAWDAPVGIGNSPELRPPLVRRAAPTDFPHEFAFSIVMHRMLSVRKNEYVDACASCREESWGTRASIISQVDPNIRRAHFSSSMLRRCPRRRKEQPLVYLVFMRGFLKFQKTRNPGKRKTVENQWSIANQKGVIVGRLSALSSRAVAFWGDAFVSRPRRSRECERA